MGEGEFGIGHHSYGQWSMSQAPYLHLSLHILLPSCRLSRRFTDGMQCGTERTAEKRCHSRRVMDA